MKSTTLFGLYGTAILALVIGFGGLTLYSIEKSRWWGDRIRLAQESRSLHLELQGNLFKLFKQHGDALILGDRGRGDSESDLRARIDQNLIDIRGIIAREIQVVGEEEFEELEVLERIEADIRQVLAALARLSASGEPLRSEVQIERLADLLEREIDIQLATQFEQSLAEELDEVAETIDDAEAFRLRNQILVAGLLLAALVLVGRGFLSFNRQIRTPLIRLEKSLARLRTGDYGQSPALGGSLEFRNLGVVLGDMARGLLERESSRREQRQQLEKTVETRTAELQRLVDQLELGEENRKRLMADISHELRTPLTIILGEADVALRTSQKLDPEVFDALARIRDSAKHTNQIVDDMLAIARQEAGQLRLDLQMSDVRKILADAASVFPHAVTLETPNAPVMLSVDSVRLRQAVLALFHNAQRYGGPDIVATLGMSGAGVRIEVADNGPGLSLHEKSHAFERFFRGPNASGSGFEGSGLGLPIVKSIVEAHGGQVSLDDAEQGGLLVRIDLAAKNGIRLVKKDATRRKA